MSLPRPSRPSVNPPTAPLPSIPSIPVPKSRQSLGPSSDKSPNSTSPSSGLPKPGNTRTVSSPFAASYTNGSPTSAPGTPNPDKALPSLPQGKQLRKTASYNVFPRPASADSRPPSTHSIASTATTPRSSQRQSSLMNGANSSRPTSSATTASARGSRGLSYADKKSVSSMSVHSIDPTRDMPSVGESAVEDDEPRGRPSSTAGPKDKGNVTISVRVRPDATPTEGKDAQGEWMVDGRQSLIAYKGKEGGDYVYDNVFTTHDKNAKVYDSAAKRLVRRVMEGYHGTVFAYGMTGTGKTFSMQGTATSPGVIPLAITDIFSFIRETPEREFLLRVSYLEIYNEKINDLLSAPLTGAAGQGVTQQEEIKLREDSKRGVYASPLKEEIVQSPTQLLRVIARGDHGRRSASTQYNARSSRSHAVVQIVVESRERNAGAAAIANSKKKEVVPGGVRVSTLSLIDLAGSERAAESKERRTEGAHINKSLLTLGTVISKLSGQKDKTGQPTDKEGKHLPYRDSKLTRLLQGALSGGSLISILCTIQVGASGSSALAGNHTLETLNTLKFAARARNNIISHAKKAEEAHGNIGDAGSRALLDRYRFEILDLRKQLDQQKVEGEKVKVFTEDEDERAKQAEQEKEADERHEEHMLELQLAKTALRERIEHLNRLILSSKSIGVNRSANVTTKKSERGSIFSNTSKPRSVRSSATSNFDTAPSSRASIASTSTVGPHTSMQVGLEPGQSPEEEEEDTTFGENGDGIATLAAQVRSLQSDLSDKNRYISTLEKRLLQARRSSRSRVSMSFNRTSTPIPEDQDVESSTDATIREKDAEIADLRARIDDKDRMLCALQSAARKRDTAVESPSRPGSVATTERSFSEPPPAMSNGTNSRRVSSGSIVANNAINGYPASKRTSGNGANGSISRVASLSANGPVPAQNAASPVGKLMQLAGGSPQREIKRGHGVDDMTRLLDEMIRQRVESGGGLPHAHASKLSQSNTVSGLEIHPSRRRSIHTSDTPTSTIEVPGTTPTSPTSVSPPSASRAAKRITRGLSTDGTRLSGWESDIRERRRSLKTQYVPNTSSSTSVPPSPARPMHAFSSSTVQSSPTMPVSPNNWRNTRQGSVAELLASPTKPGVLSRSLSSGASAERYYGGASNPNNHDPAKTLAPATNERARDGSDTTVIDDEERRLSRVGTSAAMDEDGSRPATAIAAGQ